MTMRSGPSPEYLALLRGLITPQEYAEIVKRQVAERSHAERRGIPAESGSAWLFWTITALGLVLIVCMVVLAVTS